MTIISPLDRPNSYIGRSVPRPNAKRLLAGRGRYVTDIVLPNLADPSGVSPANSSKDG